MWFDTSPSFFEYLTPPSYIDESHSLGSERQPSHSESSLVDLDLLLWDLSEHSDVKGILEALCEFPVTLKPYLGEKKEAV